MKTRHILFFTIALICVSFISSAQRGVRIGYIDMEYILENVPEYREASTQLDGKVQRWKADIEKKQQEVDLMKTTLTNERVLLTKELIEEREEEIKIKENKNYKAVIGNFKLTNLKSNLVQYLNPEIRIYSNPETLTYEAAIKTRVTSDLYLTMSNVSRSDYYNIKFQKKPFMIWIWISALMISLGGFMQLILKKNEN